jgi:hypothetical protein
MRKKRNGVTELRGEAETPSFTDIPVILVSVGVQYIGYRSSIGSAFAQ